MGCVLLAAGRVRAEVRINELVSSNGGSWHDETGATPDWIELHNPGPGAVALGGYGLSDDPAIPFKWTFPARTLTNTSKISMWQMFGVSVENTRSFSNQRIKATIRS